MINPENDRLIQYAKQTHTWSCVSCSSASNSCIKRQLRPEGALKAELNLGHWTKAMDFS
jgi:succinate dehydrogenase/fumarate reductase-like Fe-S protein